MNWPLVIFGCGLFYLAVAVSFSLYRIRRQEAVARQAAMRGRL